MYICVEQDFGPIGFRCAIAFTEVIFKNIIKIKQWYRIYYDNANIYFLYGPELKFLTILKIYFTILF